VVINPPWETEAAPGLFSYFAGIGKVFILGGYKKKNLGHRVVRFHQGDPDGCVTRRMKGS
jgi:hypothetical protein